ncbi:NADH-quinone oxidoreductase subunit J [Paenactinomyces guangxiensis]|uniref:NADH-quinone oxidoreductase subunit J n=1 Tax=Paenactinomyces guangxiensis TaxID=1490290 RepID=A0A7W1WTX0_9BACL|nr:NADH-quinone oxidoreductase subunit J [Paenactinomyces guangxiensis]MBA4495969.1 NADH-quinone oxidoreductase subunit J [Paenactinomyces guangxiensis]MBH8593044.1 NADH-quinone oxidoreductase subunit J [Paenactinomyces guangxiensis]
MTGEFIAFFILSVMAIGGAVFMINFTRVIHMALALAFTFFSIAGIYLLLNAEFLAVVQILIYTGAVSILMLFGIMLTKHKDEDQGSIRPMHSVLSFIGVAAFFGVVMWIIYQTPIAGGTADPKLFGVAKLGETVFKQYVIPFELASVLLLVALVGAVILAKKEEK